MLYYYNVSVKVSVNNLKPGTSVAVFEIGTTNTILLGVSTGSSIYCDYNGSVPVEVIIRARRTGYLPFEMSAYITSAGLHVYAIMIPDHITDTEHLIPANFVSNNKIIIINN